MDVRLTADGCAVVLHDATLERTTSGAGRVSERTLAQIQALDAGAWFGDDFAGERVPTLAEALGLSLPVPLPSGPAARWLIELKRDDAEPARLVECVLTAIAQARAADTARLISFDTALLSEAQRQAPELKRGIIADKDAAWLLDAAGRLGCAAVHPHHALVTPGFVAAAHTHGWIVNAWTVNDATTVARMAAFGVDEITSDFPDLVLAELRRLGLREGTRRG